MHQPLTYNTITTTTTTTTTTTIPNTHSTTKKTKPPTRAELQQGLGPIFTILVGLAFAAHPFLILFHGSTGLLLAWVAVVSLLFVDHFTSPLSARIIHNMNRVGGYSYELIATCVMINLMIYWVPCAVPIWMFGTTDNFSVDLGTIFNVLLILCVSEVYFSISHKILHRYLPKLHVMHHYCDYCSFTSNLLFHPLDLAIEFGVPLLIIGVIGGVVLQDTPTMVVGYAVVMTWYVLDHDQYLQLGHWRHHKYCSGHYSIYVPAGGFDALDGVKPLLRAKGKGKGNQKGQGFGQGFGQGLGKGRRIGYGKGNGRGQ